MTHADMDAFGAKLRRARNVMGGTVGVTQELIEDYFDDLQEFPWPVVEAAIDRCRRTERFFPRPASIRTACLSAPGVAALTEIPSWANRDRGRYCCDICEDTGFERGLECTGDGRCHVGGCGRERHQNSAHAYTRACRCRQSNPVLVHAREAIRLKGTQFGQEVRT